MFGKNTSRRSQVIAIAMLLGISLSFGPSAKATITGVAGGDGAPATTLGPYTMAPFGTDSQSNGTVSSVQTPYGTFVSFTPSLDHLEIGDGWATWSNGYTGDVYSSDGGSTDTLGLPANTVAFYFYAEPNIETGSFNITATAQDGTQVVQSMTGTSSADYYGFYATAGDEIVSITVTADAGAEGFAVGEFAIANVPEPGSLSVLTALSLIGLARRRRGTVLRRANFVVAQ
jgi:hypothetical protein